MGWMEAVLALYEIAKVHTSWRLSISGNVWGPAMTINEWGTAEQKQKYIPGLVSGKTVGSFAITEANTGSDVGSMKTFAIDKGDHWLLNGSKMWISGGHTCDVGLVYAATEKGGGAKGLSCFIVDYNNTPGITRIPILKKVGMWPAPTSELVFENVVIPKENLLGPLNKGFIICMWMLNNTRMGCATGSAALSAACLEGSVQYAGCNAAVHGANMAMKIYGSYGYSTEYSCGRWLRDAKQFETLEGTSNIHAQIIANIELGYQPNR